MILTFRVLEDYISFPFPTNEGKEFIKIKTDTVSPMLRFADCLFHRGSCAGSVAPIEQYGEGGGLLGGGV